MRNAVGTWKRYPLWAGLLVLIAGILLSFESRRGDFDHPAGTRDLFATYHVLLTITALGETPASDHLFLPTVSLGRDIDKQIPWGLAVPSKGGDFIYTSFPPLGFLAPYAVLRAFDAEPSVRSLARFNAAVGAVSAILLFLLLFVLLETAGFGAWTAAGGALAGGSVAVFSREALLSHGLVYWAHSLYQPVLVLSIYCTFRCLRPPADPASRRYSAALVTLAALGPLVEWTAHVTNAGIAFVLWRGHPGGAAGRALAARVAAASAFAAALTVAHLSAGVGPQAAANALLERFVARVGHSGAMTELLQGYALSFGAFLPTIAAMLAISWLRRGVRHGASTAMRYPGALPVLILGVAVVPLLENALLLQHAGRFSFDRLKFVVPAAMLIAFCFAEAGARWRAITAALVLASCVQGYWSYREDLDAFSGWSAVDHDNRVLAREVATAADPACSEYGSNIRVRGYANVAFHHGIHEQVSLRDVPNMLARKGACAAVFLEGEWAYPDLPRYTRALITLRDGDASIVSVAPGGAARHAWLPVPDDFFLTDVNWDRGVARRWAGFFLPKRERYSNDFRPGRLVKFADGQVRRIVRAETSGPYLNVFVEGSPLIADKAGLPSVYTVREGP